MVGPVPHDGPLGPSCLDANAINETSARGSGTQRLVGCCSARCCFRLEAIWTRMEGPHVLFVCIPFCLVAFFLSRQGFLVRFRGAREDCVPGLLLSCQEP